MFIHLGQFYPWSRDSMHEMICRIVYTAQWKENFFAEYIHARWQYCSHGSENPNVRECALSLSLSVLLFLLCLFSCNVFILLYRMNKFEKFFNFLHVMIILNVTNAIIRNSFYPSLTTRVLYIIRSITLHTMHKFGWRAFDSIGKNT